MLVNQEDRTFHEKESPSEVECYEADVDEPSSDSRQLLITDVLDIIQDDSNQGDFPFCLNYAFAFVCFCSTAVTVYLVIIDGNGPMRQSVVKVIFLKSAVPDLSKSHCLRWLDWTV